MNELTKLNETIKIALELERYFNSKIIGSYLFCYNYLELKDINDIDVLVISDNFLVIDKYLIDKGFIKTKSNISILNYPQNRDNIIYNKKNCIPLHIIYGDKNLKVMNFYDMIKAKLLRGKNSDYIQCLKIIKKLQEKNIKNE